MNLSRWIYTFTLVCTGVVSAGTIEQIYIKDNTPSLKGGSVQIVCEVSQFGSSDILSIYRTDTRPDNLGSIAVMNRCNPSLCLAAIERYTFITSNSSVKIAISNLKRSEDEKWFTCAFGDQKKQLQLTAYTVPQTLQLVSPPSQDQDLAENDVTLKCSTGCTYPKPSLKWFYTETGGSLTKWSTPGTDSDTTGGCTDSERIYTSTLSLARYSTFPGNLDKTVKFTCGITTFTGMTQPLYTNPSVNIQFAVPATTPTISNQTTGKLIMMENDSISMECVSSSTRPVAIVSWKKGTQTLSNIQNINSTASGGLMIVRSIVTFTPVRNDDNEVIYCETAIPGQQTKAVSQQTITVYWPPSVPSISTNDFPFLEGQSGKTLSCSSVEYGNPTSSALWDNSYGTQDTGDSKTLNLPTLNRDIDKSRVSCQLRNHFTQAKGLAVTSPTIIMDVQYKPVVQIMVSGQNIQSITKIEGENFATICSALGNPVPSVRWIGQASTSSELRFTDIDRKDHGTYTCRAEATSEKYPHHDFVTLRNLSLVVFYRTSVTAFFIEGNEASLPVQEHHEELEFICEVDSNPASIIKIMFEGKVLKRESNTKNLTFSIKRVACLDMGVYTCEGYNNYGPSSRKDVTLFVICPPRPFHKMKENVTSLLFVPVTLQFTAIAYPPLGPEGFSWAKLNGNWWTPLLSNADLQISAAALQTNLTILNVSHEDFGIYRLNATNSKGSYVQYFRFSRDGPDHTSSPYKCQQSEQTALIIGITLGVVCCALASLAFYLNILRMRTNAKERKSLSRSKKEPTFANPSFASDVAKRQEYENLETDQGEASDQQQYTDLSRYANTDKDTYDVIIKT